jgi:hypothetical protein
MNEINITISVYFEVENAEVFGGEGSTGYMEQRIGITLEKQSKLDLYEYAKVSIKNIAKMLAVPEEDIRTISGQEYEEKTEEEE